MYSVIIIISGVIKMQLSKIQQQQYNNAMDTLPVDTIISMLCDNVDNDNVDNDNVDNDNTTLGDW